MASEVWLPFWSSHNLTSLHLTIKMTGNTPATVETLFRFEAQLMENKPSDEAGAEPCKE